MRGNYKPSQENDAYLARGKKRDKKNKRKGKRPFLSARKRIQFGKYKGEEIQSVIVKDPDYVEWAQKTFRFN